MIEISIWPNTFSQQQHTILTLCINNIGQTTCRDIYIQFDISREITIITGGRPINKSLLKPGQYEERILTVLGNVSGTFLLKSVVFSYWNTEGSQESYFSIPLTVLESLIIEESHETDIGEFDSSKLINLHSLIEQQFNLDELSNLCFRLGVDYENLEGVTKSRKSQELVKYCERHNQLEQLIKQCLALRPYADWML